MYLSVLLIVQKQSTKTFLLHFMQENRESVEQFFAEYREAGKKYLKRT